MQINCESDVRRWVRENWTLSEPIWVEHAPGGTPGIADLLLPIDGVVFFIELKEQAMKDGFWAAFAGGSRGGLKPSQIKMAKKLWLNGVRTFFLIGSSVDNTLWITDWSDLESKEKAGWPIKCSEILGYESLLVYLTSRGVT